MKRRGSAKNILVILAIIVAASLVIRLRTLSLHASAVERCIPGIYNPGCTPDNPYGTTVDRSATWIPGAVVEKVTIFSQKDSNEPQQRLERNGVLVRYPSARATILISHGFMCDKFDAGFLRHMFNPGEYNFLTYDFRGHGERSQGQRSTLGRDEAYDAIAAARFIREHEVLKDLPVIGYGFSMGAVASIEAQAKDPVFDALILDCPFACSQEVLSYNMNHIKFSILGYQFGIPGKSILEKYAFHPYLQVMVKTILKAVSKMDSKHVDLYVCPFKPQESIQTINVPAFFIHCKNDHTVPLDAIKRLYDGAKGYKRLWITNGRRHFDSFFYNPERYSQQIKAFLDDVLTGRYKELQQEATFEDSDDFLSPAAQERKEFSIY